MEELKKKKLVVVGGGAAGMLSAVLAADYGWDVLLIEKNEKLGKKLFITGKGRCNITNACDREEFFEHIMTGRKFMYSSFSGFSNFDLMDFFEKLSLPLKTERGGRVFPVSDKSSDVIKALERALGQRHVSVTVNTEVTEIIVQKLCREKEADGKSAVQGKVCGVSAVMGEGKTQMIPADAVFIATGGVSYPLTGSTGDGYCFAEKTGHTVTEPVPSLVPFETKETFVKDLMGLSLKNISITVWKGKKKLYSDFGEMLFTHFGVSGPVILSASSAAARELQKNPLELSIDFKPALSEEQLDTRILRDFSEFQKKQFKNALDKLLPKTLIPVIIERTGISPEKKVSLLTREERGLLVRQIKDFRLTLTGLRGFSEAIITKGGVSVKDINPATMESKKVKGLYFIGEVLDVDALTGGFNLQIAWSTAAAAARGLGENLQTGKRKHLMMRGS